MPMECIDVIKNMYFETQGIVEGKVGEQQQKASFKTNKGVKQGDNASPGLFTLLFDRVVSYIQ